MPEKRYKGKSVNFVDVESGQYVLLSPQVVVFSDPCIKIKKTNYLMGIIDKLQTCADIQITGDDVEIKCKLTPEFENIDKILVKSWMQIDDRDKSVLEVPVYYPYSYLESPLKCSYDEVIDGQARTQPFFGVFASVDGSFLVSMTGPYSRRLIIGGTMEGNQVKLSNFHKSMSKKLDNLTDAFPDIFSLHAIGGVSEYKTKNPLGGYSKTLLLPLPTEFNKDDGDFVVVEYELPKKVSGKGTCTLIAEIR